MKIFVILALILLCGCTTVVTTSISLVRDPYDYEERLDPLLIRSRIIDALTEEWRTNENLT